jgi:hypothetical protein
MRIDTASHFMESDQLPITLAPAANEARELRVIQIEPEDPLEAVLMTLRLQAGPVILLLPEQGQAFHVPSHFAQLRQVRSPDEVSFAIPQSQIRTLGRYAHQHGFSFASSLEQAAQSFPVREEQSHTDETFQGVKAVSHEQETDAMLDMQVALIEEKREEQDVPGPSGQATVATAWSPPSPEHPLRASAHPARLPSATRRIGLMAVMVSLLVLAGIVLLPALFSSQPALMSTTQPAASAATVVGQATFLSSGQLNPASSQGLNDVITVHLYHLTSPAGGHRYDAWLLPDTTDEITKPLLLGKLSVADGNTQLTYTSPDHENLLAAYSGFAVTEQPSDQNVVTPSFNPNARRYVGQIPNMPTPGDEQHYSLLSHMRHLLAQDPELQELGLQGGLNIWLYRNTEKVLEWSSAARDSWQGGQQTALIHRQMLRVLDYLDGAAYVYTSGDVPPGSPLLVDPQAGRIGLLQVGPTQVLPAYLTHVDLHLHGLINAPGHTEAQRQLANKIDVALKLVTALLQKVHRDAAKLVKMNDTQLKSNETLTLLNDMVTNATSAYAGQFDPTTGGNINGVVLIYSELQGLATMPVTGALANKQ